MRERAGIGVRATHLAPGLDVPQREGVGIRSVGGKCLEGFCLAEEPLNLRARVRVKVRVRVGVRVGVRVRLRVRARARVRVRVRVRVRTGR